MMNAQQQRISAGAKRAYAVMVLVALVVMCDDARSSAQVGEAPRVRAASEISEATPEMRARAYSKPAIDPVLELKGAALLNALRGGGFVLFMRHTQTGTVTETCGPSNLTPAGERDARFVGQSIRELSIRIDTVWTSPICRVADTAKLLGFNAVQSTPALANRALSPGFDFDTARERLIAVSPAQGMNTLLVSHIQSGGNISTWLMLDFGDIIVFKPDGKGAFAPRARIRPDDWPELKTINHTKGGRHDATPR